MPDQEKFQGIWIPKEIWKDNEISFMQRVLLAEVYHLQDPERGGWAYPSNHYLGSLFGSSPNWVSKNLSVLIEKGYVEASEHGRGLRNRLLRVRRYGDVATFTTSYGTKLVNTTNQIGQSDNIKLVNPPTGEYIESIEKNTIAPTDQNRSVPKPVTYSFTTGLFSGVSDEMVATWQAMCPAINVDREIVKAAQWLLANPTKRKKNYRKFLVNWILRSQERGKG